MNLKKKQLNAGKMLDTGSLKNIGLITGVPCSFFKGMINAAINRKKYIEAVDEGAAIAIATGYQISSGKKALVLMQNSGIGNAISPLTSLNYVFREPITLMVSQRGGPDDEPQHELMGTIDSKLLNLCNLKTEEICETPNVENYSEKTSGKAYLVPKNTFEFEELDSLSEITKNCWCNRDTNGDELQNTLEINVSEKFGKLRKKDILSRYEALEIISSVIKKIHAYNQQKYVIIATTGYTGRELFTCSDTENNLYMVGSMGCALPLGIGFAVGNPELKVYVIDGDGSLLMRTGSMGTAGDLLLPNLVHIVLDNKTYSTTGGQARGCTATNFVKLADAFGYTLKYQAITKIGIELLLSEIASIPITAFLYIPIKSGNEKVGRPTLKPYEIKERLVKYINK